jgi:acyl-CoA reductase-like NAD-dependent aldehyde dehydrogenase
MPSEPNSRRAAAPAAAPARAAPSRVEVPSFIGAQWRKGAGASAPLLDKFSGAAVGEVFTASREQVAAAVAGTAAAARRGAPGPYERGEILERAAVLVQERQERLVDTMRVEAGFTTADATGEVTRCVQTLRLCAEEARRLCGEMVPMEGAPGQAGRLGFTLRVPLGVVCAITPFNSPLNGLAHKVGPAFAAGNAAIVKPSLFTPLTANALAEALLQAGLPGDFLAVLHGGAEVGQWLLDEPGIAFYAFTGSTQVGREIQKSVGLRRSQMELGSIAHCVVDEGAHVARALPRIVSAAYRKAGQVCTSVQTLLVHRSVYDEALAGLRAQVLALAYGEPSRAGCVVGPVISEEAAVRVEAWVDEAVAQGAERVCGARRVGSVVPPVLLAATSAAMKVRRLEVFGPVLNVVPFDDFAAALAAIDATPFGLSCGIFTNSLDRALLAARTVRSGAVHINESSSSRADLMPFGGSKDSGFGREGPRYAIREMSEERLVTLAT